MVGKVSLKQLEGGTRSQAVFFVGFFANVKI